MPEITLRHEIDTDEDTFWSRIVFDEGFNQKLYVEGLKFPQWKLLEVKDDDAKLTRRVFVEPATGDLPGPLKKAIGGDKLAYTEEGTFDKKSKRYSFKTTTSLMPDKIKVSGELWAEKIGDKKVRRVAKMHVEVKIFMVGGMFEDRIIKDLQASYDASTSIANRYIHEQGL